MKKITLFAAMAIASSAAMAQYTAESPYVEPTAKDGSIFDVIVMDQNSQDQLTKLGKTVNAIGPNDDNRNLYYWENTVDTGSASFPGVGWDDLIEGGYVSLNVTDKGWSGAGFAIGGEGVNLKHLTEDTHFHMAYRTEGNAPASTAVIILDLDGAGAAGKVALGDPFVDNGQIFPAVAPQPGEDWVALDITLGALKKIYPSFNVDKQKVEKWNGNVLSFLQGGVTGNNVCYDAIYFYTPDAAGVNSLGAENKTSILYTGKTINAAGADGIKVYDLDGRLVKSTNSTVVGVEGLAKGVYVAVAGNNTVKVVVK